MHTFVKVKFQIEGLHCWPAAKQVFPEVAYLSDLHRHVFHFHVTIPVSHDDRDREFIMFKHELVDHITSKYWSEHYRCCNFAHRSCEMLAREIFDEFQCHAVEVSEDDENSAIITR